MHWTAWSCFTPRQNFWPQHSAFLANWRYNCFKWNGRPIKGRKQKADTISKSLQLANISPRELEISPPKKPLVESHNIVKSSTPKINLNFLSRHYNIGHKWKLAQRRLWQWKPLKQNKDLEHLNKEDKVYQQYHSKCLAKSITDIRRSYSMPKAYTKPSIYDTSAYLPADI